MNLISARLYELIATDRDNVEKAKKAFVSYIRAYKEHDLRYIFEFKNIDIGQIANSFFLYRIPRIK
jgi:ATP-dependent RNA helicase DDX55/SPB4